MHSVTKSSWGKHPFKDQDKKKRKKDQDRLMDFNVTVQKVHNISANL